MSLLTEDFDSSAFSPAGPISENIVPVNQYDGVTFNTRNSMRQMISNALFSSSLASAPIGGPVPVASPNTSPGDLSPNQATTVSWPMQQNGTAHASVQSSLTNTPDSGRGPGHASTRVRSTLISNILYETHTYMKCNTLPWSIGCTGYTRLIDCTQYLESIEYNTQYSPGMMFSSIS